MNPYFNHINNRVAQGSRALESQINNIADEIAVGFDRLPTETELKDNTAGYAASTGTVDALVADLPYVPALNPGFNLFVLLNGTNTGAATINVNSTGVKSLVGSSGVALLAGAMVSGTIIHIAYDQANDRYILISNNSVIGGGGGAGGTGWEKIGSTTTPPAANNFSLSWDESLYIAIEIHMTGIRVDTDNSTIQFRVAHTDGSDISDTVGNYDYLFNNFTATAWTQDATESTVVMANGDMGNRNDSVIETFNAKIELYNMMDVDLGCAFETDCYYGESGTDHKSRWLRGFIGERNGVEDFEGAVDTIIFSCDGVEEFLAVGAIHLYGLLR